MLFKKKFLRGTKEKPFDYLTSHHYYLDLKRHDCNDMWELINKSKAFQKHKECVLDHLMHTMDSLR